MGEVKKNPKVFISYSWTSQEHEDFIVDFATRLRVDGIDVVLDKWDLREGQDKHQFMERMVSDASVEKVLLILDKRYVEKANERKGGVGTESQIVSGELYANVSQTKFIPIVVEYFEDGQPCLPTFLKSRIFIDLSPQSAVDNYQRVVRNIYDKPLYEKPPLGTRPTFLDENPDGPTLRTHYQVKKTVLNGTDAAKRLEVNAFFDDLKKQMRAIASTDVSTGLVDENVFNLMMSTQGLLKQFDDFVDTIAIAEPSLLVEKFGNFFEECIGLYNPQTGSKSDAQSDLAKFLSQELFLHLVAVFIRYEQFDCISQILKMRLLKKDNYGKSTDTAACLWSTVPSIDSTRNERLRLNKISLSTEILKERCTTGFVSFEELAQADYLIFIHFFLKSHWWYPRTLHYFGSYHKFDIFVRGESKQYFLKLKEPLGILSKVDLETKIKTLAPKLPHWRIVNTWPINLLDPLNLKDLDTQL